MDRQLFIDRILETENLTDHLEDDEADALLNWGVAQVDGLIAGLDDDEQAGSRINDLMHVMRGLNSLAGSPERVSHEAVTDLVNRFSAMAGTTVQVEEAERQSLVEQVSKMGSGEAVQFLTKWLQTKKS